MPKLRYFTWLQASTAKYTRPALCWVIAQRMVVICYWCSPRPQLLRLYCVGGRIMNRNGALADWHWQGKSCTGATSYITSTIWNGVGVNQGPRGESTATNRPNNGTALGTKENYEISQDSRYSGRCSSWHLSMQARPYTAWSKLKYSHYSTQSLINRHRQLLTGPWD